MRTKKTWIYLGIAALLSSAVLVFGQERAEAKTSADFADLKDLDAATKAKFDAMISAGIFDGVAEGTFGLKDEMNRAQFAKVAALIYGLKVDESLKTSSFSDVKSDDPANGYALPYIEAVKAAGITNGVSDGKFDPAGDVTKEQLATFLVRGLGKNEDAKDTPGVNDNTVSDWAKGYVALALELKLLSNGADGKFGGSSNATRDLLVVGAYEAKEQYVSSKPSSSPSPSPTATPKPTPTATPTATPAPTPTATPYNPPYVPPVTPTATSVSPTPTATPYVPPVVPTPTPTVSAITGYEVGQGSVAGSVKISGYEKAYGNDLQIVVASTATTAPYTGTNISTIVGSSSYTIGHDILNVSVGQHIRLYEADSAGIIVKFADIAINSSHLAELAPYLVDSHHISYQVNISAETVTVYLSQQELANLSQWQYKTSAEPQNPLMAGEAFNGQVIQPGDSIDVSNGKVHVTIAAVDSNGLVLAYVPFIVRLDQPDVFSLSSLYAGTENYLYINFEENLSSDTTDLDATELIDSITVTRGGTIVNTVDLGDVTITWPNESIGGPFGPPGMPGMPGMPSFLEINISSGLELQIGDVVRVTFKEGALKDSSDGAITQTYSQTTVELGPT